MAEFNANARLEGFSDGILAFALTLLIIDIKLPPTEHVGSTLEFWRALARLAPPLGSFLLSFAVIFVTWVNHHGAIRLLGSTSSSFFYANGLLMLTVVFIPFPTALLGEFIASPYPAPAVVLYNAVLVVQAVAWVLLFGAAISNHLETDDRAKAKLHEMRRNGYFAAVFYAVLAIAAFWLPIASAGVTLVSWVFWVTLSIRAKHV